MAYIALADRGQVLSHPHSFITKYIWSQDHKVIAIQYSITAISVGLVALVLSGMMRLQLGFPDTFLHGASREYLMKECRIDAFGVLTRCEEMLKTKFKVTETELNQGPLESSYGKDQSVKAEDL